MRGTGSSHNQPDFRQEVKIMKSMLAITLLATLLLLMASAALADKPAVKAAAKQAPQAKELTGQDLFKAHCKVCHGPDADAGEYTPISYIMEQWEEFFDELWTETHGEISCPKADGKKVTDMLDKDMLKKIRKFCVDHAADSEQPMTCG